MSDLDDALKRLDKWIDSEDITTIRKGVEELRKDRKRLDWLDAHGVSLTYDTKGGNRHKVAPDNCTWRGLLDIHVGDTVSPSTPDEPAEADDGN